MFRATIRGLLARKVRLLFTALSIVLGVGFVAGTYVLTDTMNAAFDELFAGVSQSSDVTVRSVSAFAPEPAGPGGGGEEREPLPASLLEEVQEVASVAAAEGSVQGYAQVVDPESGEPIGGVGPPTIGTNWNAFSDGVLTLREGREPRDAGEVVVDAVTARTYSLAVGGEVQILFVEGPEPFTIVGIAGFGEADNLGGATLAVFDTATAQRVLDKEGVFDAIEARGDEGVTPIRLRDDIQAVLPAGTEAVTTADVGAEQAAQFREALGFFETALLVFAGVALFVGSFIIFNTFSIIVAQRTRELALLRALGASRRQVLVSVVAEAIAIGLVTSAVGILAGIAIAAGLQALLGVFGIDIPSTGIVVAGRTIVVSLVVGTVITTLAAILPARRAASVAPIEALREADPAAVHARTRGRRLALAGLVTLVGIGSLLFGLFGSPAKAYIYVGFGAAITFIGVAMLSPSIAGPVASVVGAPMARVGAAGGLGRRNAMRNPRRTARTAAALMIGLGLVSMVAILAASLKASFDAALERSLRADFTVATTSFTPFSPQVAEEIAAVDGVAASSPFRQGGFRIGDASAFVTGFDPATIEAVTSLTFVDGGLASLGVDGVLVSETVAVDNGWDVGEEIDAAFGSIGERPLTVAGILSEPGVLGDYSIALATYGEVFTQELDAFVLVKAEPGADFAAVQGAIGDAVASYGNIEVLDQASFREKQAGFIDQILGLITALLAMAIVIALFGIVNTLSLSIHERTRELGLLRAIGMSRRQARRMVRVEAVIIALFGALLGIAVGVFFGWALQRSLAEEGVSELMIPVGTLVVYLAIAGLAGVLAAIPPARRASKLDVLQAISYE
ncbi:MAG TPA: FtsX-like permease family protein [Actinomycetota bacterium]